MSVLCNTWTSGGRGSTQEEFFFLFLARLFVTKPLRARSGASSVRRKDVRYKNSLEKARGKKRTETTFYLYINAHFLARFSLDAIIFIRQKWQVEDRRNNDPISVRTLISLCITRRAIICAALFLLAII